MNDRALFKFTSARFLMALVTTLVSSGLTVYIVMRYPNGAAQAAGQYFTVWMGIVGFYFAAKPTAGSGSGDKNVVQSGDQK